MSVLRPRSRLVYFRVSEDEFQQLNEMCLTAGARSISDLARQAIQKALTDGRTGVETRDLVERIDRLTESVEGLKARLAAGQNVGV